ncbi:MULTISPECIES: aminoglycoside phosphotransferase family protein [Streptomyces]|uniref:Phosphotransferase n=1 Tax=Streptomyces tsukubensis (strain DSM 42081 / NBRC 108919 / NRRL 18488 / 9993) TaxID=1114943 RepID=A0A7G3U7D8_STRT9|nr:aminoglycoside phosphotransferase family protein [Streptomyces tsukubensis]AZK97690.1 phosphotransferase [Streptomyces tsukubensis]MYS64351.1 phosphotransferase [Streptomyces sp. SID5473]QKM66374.1 phosphotransferase [Streptomyces tsukubensis NRRL18488]TAI45287.1 aminoglycoside phosphotransferase family protein [Streptomyces tsukubensis]
MAQATTGGTRPAIGAALARRLVDDQFPRWSGLPLAPVEPGGSDHVIFRLGGELSVRLPRHEEAVGQAAKEYTWLPRLAPHLPLAVPVPVAVGEPGFGYPWPWAVSRWLDGDTATPDGIGESAAAAETLAGFLTALQRFAPAGPEGAEALRDPALTAEPLAALDGATRAAIAATGGVFDAAAMTAVWDAALAAPARQSPPVWFHGDFHTGNLLTRGGRPSAVIDFGSLGLGDPARDLMMAFTLLSPRTRPVFRAALGADEAMWTRGRGWALATGLNAYRHYAAVNPRVAAQTSRQIAAAIAG